jgi:hypothetical protein
MVIIENKLYDIQDVPKKGCLVKYTDFDPYPIKGPMFRQVFSGSKAPNGSKINQITINIGPLGDLCTIVQVSKLVYHGPNMQQKLWYQFHHILHILHILLGHPLFEKFHEISFFWGLPVVEVVLKGFSNLLYYPFRPSQG